MPAIFETERLVVRPCTHADLDRRGVSEHYYDKPLQVWAAQG